MIKTMPTINGFWSGPFGETENLSIESFIQNGHPYQLWTYEKQKIPFGVNQLNASDIVPIKTYNKWMQYDYNHIMQSFANYFRYKLLHKIGGFWCDLDVICIKPFDFKQDYVFCNVSDIPTRPELYKYFNILGPYGHLVNTIMKCPKNCPMLQNMIQEIENAKKVPEIFGTWGAVLLTKNIIKYNLLQHKVNHLIDYGISYAKRQFNDPNLPIPNGYSIHLYNYLKEQNDNKNSLYDKLKKRYL